MLVIGNNSKNIIIKFISILLNQTFYVSTEIVDTYKNNIYNDFDIGDECVCSNLIGYDYITNNGTELDDRFSYCKIDYVGGTVTEIVKMEETLTEAEKIIYTNTSSYGSDSIAKKKRLLYRVLTSNDCYGRVLKTKYYNYIHNIRDEYTDQLTDKEKEDIAKFLNSQDESSSSVIDEIETNDSLFVETYFESVKIPAGSLIVCRKSTMKQAKTLPAIIAMYLNSRFPIILNTNMDYSFDTVIRSDICRYFASKEITFNSAKKDFDLDSFVMSFLLGRTIGPTSTMEDIEYVQKLLEDSIYTNYYHNRYGEWDDELTATLYDYQKAINKRYVSNGLKETNNYKDYNIIFPTGYFDIITEKYLLQDKTLTGADLNDAYSTI